MGIETFAKKAAPPLPPPPHIVAGDVGDAVSEVAEEAKQCFEHGPVQGALEGVETLFRRGKHRFTD